MRIKTYNLICHTLFWTKTFIALLAATGGLGYLSYRVYDLTNIAYGDPFIQESLLASESSPNKLIPPAPYVFMGFSINWYISDPSKFSLNGKRPLL